MGIMGGREGGWGLSSFAGHSFLRERAWVRFAARTSTVFSQWEQ